MPIEHNVAIHDISDEEFHSVDYRVMGHLFTIHSDLGRLCDEEVYKNLLALRVQAAGLGTVRRELPIKIWYRDFVKRYFVDFLLTDKLLYELKTRESLIAKNRAQTLNYMLLLGLRHGKLVNMRPASIESRFISTRLTHAKRRAVTVTDDQWLELDEASVSLRELIVALTADWGMFLELELYGQALTHFLGGEENVVQRIGIRRDGVLLGTQFVHLVSPSVCYKLTAITHQVTNYEAHLRRFLKHTDLKALQWINLNHQVLEMRTLRA